MKEKEAENNKEYASLWSGNWLAYQIMQTFWSARPQSNEIEITL